MQKFRLFDTLGFLTINTAFQAKQNLNHIFHKSGLNATVDQFVILSVLIAQDGIVQKEISELCNKSDSNLVRLLNGMESKDLIRRQTGKDARSRRIFLTEKGTLLQQELEPMAAAYNKRLFEGFTSEDEENYKNLLMRMRENLSVTAPLYKVRE